jgi:predicted nucleotidyltransferase component of viral defense system
MNAPHADPDAFLAALGLTREHTGFAERLIEKDYFCTMALAHLASPGGELVFKGGTCLAKVHADFYRLSEDMDFTIPIAVDASRSQRSQTVRPWKTVLDEIPRRLPCFRSVRPLTGANGSTQYVGVIAYTSLVSDHEETIKVEIGLREPLLVTAVNGEAKTVLLDPITRRSWLVPVPCRCMTKVETFAEKFRAALTRREVAARDFFDLDYAVRRLGLRTDDSELVRLVRLKLAVAGNDPMDASDRRLSELRRQVESRLRPVLRTSDFMEFDVERAFRIVSDMAARLERTET